MSTTMTKESTVTVIPTVDAINAQVAALNGLVAEHKDVDTLKSLINANIKLLNDHLMNAHAKSLVSADKCETFANYLTDQTYTAYRLTIDKDTLLYKLDTADARCSIPQFFSMAYTRKEDAICSNGGWYHMLAALSDNVTLFRIGGDTHIIRTNHKGDAFTAPTELLEFKAKYGFTCAEAVPSKRELMDQLTRVFNAVCPDGMTDVQGNPLAPIKVDLNYFIDENARTFAKKKSAGWIQASLSNMERALAKVLAMRYTRTAYQHQSQEEKYSSGKKSETEKEAAKENAGAPDMKTMPKAGPVTVKSDSEPKAAKAVKKTAKKTA